MIETFSLFAIGIILLIVEITTVTLLLLWPAVGFLAAAFISIFTDNNIIIASCGIIGATITLYFVMKYLKQSKNKKDNTVDSIIGDTGVVIKKVTKNSTEFGEVKVNGVVWNAKSKHTIDVGMSVIVEKTSGSHLVVIKKGE